MSSSYVLYCDEKDVTAFKVEAVARAACIELERQVVQSLPAHLETATAFRTLPQLQTPHGIIGSSSAMMKYLAGSGVACDLVPPESAFVESVVDQWLEWTTVDLEPCVTALLGWVSRMQQKQKQQVREAATQKLDPILLERLPAVLSRRTFLAGERLTLADVAVAAPLGVLFRNVWREHGSIAQGSPLRRWLTSVEHHPAVAALHSTPLPTTSSFPSSTPAPTATAGAAAATGAGGPGAELTVAFRRQFQRRHISHRCLAGAEGEARIGQDVQVAGWVRSMRAQKHLIFLNLSDGSTQKGIQVLVSAEAVSAEVMAAVKQSGGTGASLRVEGKVMRSPKPKQPVEVHASAVEVLGAVDAASYPLAKKRHRLETLRDMQHLRPRTNTIGAVTRVRNALAFASHKFFQELGFLYIHTPIITSSDCEGAGEMFSVTKLLPENPMGEVPREKDGSIAYSQDFFHRPASLTVSGQLQVECFSCSMSDVCTFGPTFRAEQSHTARHLAEFWMIEPEIAFATLRDDMDLAEDFLKYCTNYVLEQCPEELEFFESMFEKGLIARLHNVLEAPFERLTYTRAIELLQDPSVTSGVTFEVAPAWGIDLGSEHERFLTEQVFKKPVILTNYPKDIKAFYMRMDEDGRTVAAMDVLVPKIGELMGGSQREERLEMLQQRMQEMDVPEETIQWYLDLRRFGTVSHAGFGVGFERLVMYVTGMENIRDVIPFPRYPGHADV